MPTAPLPCPLTWERLILIFEAIADLHPDINSFGVGEEDDFAYSGEDMYPRLFLERPAFFGVKLPVKTWRVAFTITGIPKAEESDPDDQLKQHLENYMLVQLEQIGDQIMTGIIQDLRDSIGVNDGWDATSLTHYSDDDVCGWRYEFNADVRFQGNRCDFKFVLPDSLKNCP